VNSDDTVTLARSPTEQSAPSATDPDCLEETSKTLAEHSLATPDELRQLRVHGLAPLRGPRPWDPLEFLAALRVRDPDARPIEVERLGRALAQAVGQQLALIPFASKMSTPSNFYDANKDVLVDCRRLMTPVLYAEESEVIGLGSINPISLRLTAERIIATLGERTGTRPIVSRMLLHHDGWIALCQKQFGI
jgi:hypothetical protein